MIYHCSVYEIKPNHTLTIIKTGSSFYFFRGKEIDRDRERRKETETQREGEFSEDR